jgi:hypothetical protein
VVPIGSSHEVLPAQSCPVSNPAAKDPVNTATFTLAGMPSTSVSVNVAGIPALKSSEKICACPNIVLRTKLRVRSFFILFGIRLFGLDLFVKFTNKKWVLASAKRKSLIVLRVVFVLKIK